MNILSKYVLLIVLLFATACKNNQNSDLSASYDSIEYSMQKSGKSELMNFQNTQEQTDVEIITYIGRVIDSLSHANPVSASYYQFWKECGIAKQVNLESSDGLSASKILNESKNGYYITVYDPLFCTRFVATGQMAPATVSLENNFIIVPNPATFKSLDVFQSYLIFATELAKNHGELLHAYLYEMKALSTSGLYNTEINQIRKIYKTSGVGSEMLQYVRSISPKDKSELELVGLRGTLVTDALMLELRPKNESEMMKIIDQINALNQSSIEPPKAII